MTFAGIPLWTVTVLALGSAGLLAILHLLRVRPRQVRVITTLFWAHAAERSRARMLLERFRHPRTYALLLLICLLLCLALAQPQCEGEPADRIWEVVVLDAGSPLAAPDVSSDGSRFDLARQAAVAEATRLSLGDRLAVVIADPWPRLVQRFDDPRPLVAARLQGLVPAELPAAREAAIALARSLLRGHQNPRVLLITDRPVELPSPSADREEIDVEVICVGGPSGNAAVLSVMFEPDRVDPLRGRLLVRVGYWGPEPDEVRVRVLRAGGAPLLNTTALLDPGTWRDFAVPDLPADGDGLLVQLDAGDGALADDRASFRLPLRTVIRVATAGALPAPVAALLENDPTVRIVGPQDEHEVAVIAQPVDWDGVGPAVIVSDDSPPIEAGSPLQVSGTSPLVRDLYFENATCGTGARVDTDDPASEALLYAGSDVLAVLSSASDAPRLYLGSALLAADSEVARRAAFAVFLTRALRHLAGWDETPLVITPERSLDDPLWAGLEAPSVEATIMPGSRLASDLSYASGDEEAAARPTGGRWAAPGLFEIVLALAVACLLIEATLHARGRIP